MKNNIFVTEKSYYIGKISFVKKEGLKFKTIVRDFKIDFNHPFITSFSIFNENFRSLSYMTFAKRKDLKWHYFNSSKEIHYITKLSDILTGNYDTCYGKISNKNLLILIKNCFNKIGNKNGYQFDKITNLKLVQERACYSNQIEETKIKTLSI